MEEEVECPDCPAGIPAWVMTFADLMSLLMCFFVLLLSFAEMDVLKYKQVAGAMKFAFGVQKDIQAIEIPKGTSIVAKNYSPGKPTETTPLEILREASVDDDKQNLDFTDSTDKNKGETEITVDIEAAELALAKQMEQDIQEQAKQLEESLTSELKKGLVDVDAMQDRVLIRIREKGSFGSGSAKLQPSFFPVMKKIADILNKQPGQFIIAGHTDDIPIETKLYRSNWDLASARAATVVHFMFQVGDIDPSRLEIRALADNNPLKPNTSKENRAQNRRVEISVLHGNTKAIDVEPDNNLQHDSVDVMSKPKPDSDAPKIPDNAAQQPIAPPAPAPATETPIPAAPIQSAVPEEETL